MKFSVYIISDAKEDILGIYHYVSMNDSAGSAEHLLNKIEEKSMSLRKYPHRDHVPPELERIDVYNYREIHFKPYRIIYELIESNVFVHCVLDGRRSLQELLEMRLLKR
ncbi:MAG: type II toxin-antitoxin system RelE/ParE family toxin [Candidatus Aminicenantes bacterium]|nr:type II toxin-antitoxin system RelE/ParE family toxin [Candidatus Aminicenantes bacterium]